MTAAKAGFIAEFQTGYLQREIRVIAKVTGGKDKGLRDGAEGIAVGRLVTVTGGPGYGTDAEPLTITATTGVTATDLKGATHIIAQSDDTVRDVPEDYNYQERYNNLPNYVVKNSQTGKTVALFKITNPDDIKVIALGGTDPYAAGE